MLTLSETESISLDGRGGHENVIRRPPTPGISIDPGPQLLGSETHHYVCTEGPPPPPPWATASQWLSSAGMPSQPPTLGDLGLL